MRFKQLGSSSIRISAIGQGCGGIGGFDETDKTNDSAEVAGLKLGIDLGMTFIDTAPVYGKGHSEELVGYATKGIRDRVFIATKVSPENNHYAGVLRSAEESLRRLATDYIDLYQVHWPNPVIPIEETMRAMCKLVQDGKIRQVGVSNFSVPETRIARSSLEGAEIVSNQVEYNLFDRFIERQILPYCTKENITVIAYSPLDKGRFGRGDTTLLEIADRYRKTPSQVVLNWLIRQPQVVVIPKASNPKHIRDNSVAGDFDISDHDAERINEIFSPTPALVPIDQISVSVHGEGNRKVYQTLEQALRNELNFAPSPKELAADILNGEPIKPVRLVKGKSDAGKYDLIEGRIRYWAWVIAHGGKRPIPALIRQSR